MRYAREEGSAYLADKALAGMRLAASQSVHLRAGETGVRIPLTNDFEGTGAEGYILVTTSRPGVIVRIDQDGTDPDVEPGGHLMDVSADILSQYQDGTVFPCYVVGQWQNHTRGSALGYQHLMVTSAANRSFAANIIELPTDYSLNPPLEVDNTAVAQMVWGVDDYKNLGNIADGKIFQFWFYGVDVATITQAYLSFYSYPFDDEHTDTESDDGTSGTVNDNQMAKNQPILPAFDYDFASQLVESRWTLVTVHKKDFTARNHASGWGPRWDRMTLGRIHIAYSVNKDVSCKMGSVYFGDPCWMRVDIATLIPYTAVNTKPVVLSLDAPPGTDADVDILVGLI